MKTTLLIALLSLGYFSCQAQINSLIAENAELKLISDGFEFTEGPAADKKGNVYFTDQPTNRILKWDAADNLITEYLNPSGRSNGLYVDREGNLISCADEKNQLWRIDSEKNITVLIDGYEGKKLGGPNDLWIDATNGIYITDPFYKRPWWNYTEAEIRQRNVYYLAPHTNILTIAAAGFVQPNGIIGSSDGNILYISDIGDQKTYAYAINTDGSLSDKRLFCELGSDGMTIDHLGNVYLTGEGVTIFDKNGKQIAHIDVPEKWTANVTFGGSDQNMLFITAMASVYTLQMNVKGVHY